MTEVTDIALEAPGTRTFLRRGERAAPRSVETTCADGREVERVREAGVVPSHRSYASVEKHSSQRVLVSMYERGSQCRTAPAPFLISMRATVIHESRCTTKTGRGCLATPRNTGSRSSPSNVTRTPNTGGCSPIVDSTHRLRRVSKRGQPQAPMNGRSSPVMTSKEEDPSFNAATYRD